MRLALLCALLAAGPAAADESQARPGLIPVGGIMLFYNSSGPLSFVSMTRSELPRGATLLGEVRARSCQFGLSIPLGLDPGAMSLSGAAGDGGFKKALAGLQKERPELSGIYDVKVDNHLVSVLGIFRRLCVEVTALGFKQG